MDSLNPIVPLKSLRLRNSAPLNFHLFCAKEFPLTSLCLENNNFSFPGDLHKLVEYYPQLERLRLGHPDLDERIFEVILNAPSLRTLELLKNDRTFWAPEKGEILVAVVND